MKEGAGDALMKSGRYIILLLRMPSPLPFCFVVCGHKKTAAVLVAVFGVMGNAFGLARLMQDKEEEFSHEVARGDVGVAYAFGTGVRAPDGFDNIHDLHACVSLHGGND